MKISHYSDKFRKVVSYEQKNELGYVTRQDHATTYQNKLELDITIFCEDSEDSTSLMFDNKHENGYLNVKIKIVKNNRLSIKSVAINKEQAILMMQQLQNIINRL